MTFFLGTHLYHWLYDERFASIPLFVSRRRLPKNFGKKIVTKFSLDSGGFTELSMFGKWVTTIDEYKNCIWKILDATALLDWVAPMDWMCEPVMLQKTGKTIEQHQWLTIESVINLRDTFKKLVIPVLQGWEVQDYHKHIRMYEQAGIDLHKEWTVGVGSVCRRQGTKEAEEIFRSLFMDDLHNLHGFGLKIDGLKRYGGILKSSDSMAWSQNGRRGEQGQFCTHLGNCANCKDWAIEWFDKVGEII